MALATRDEVRDFLILSMTDHGRREMLSTTIGDLTRAYLEWKGNPPEQTYRHVSRKMVAALRELEREHRVRFHAGIGWAAHDDVRFTLTFMG